MRLSERTISSLERVDDLVADRRRADGVEQDFHLHTRPRPVGQRPREPLSDFARPVDVGFYGNRALCPLDRAEHRRVELVAVVQNPDVIAGQKNHVRRPGDGR